MRLSSLLPVVLGSLIVACSAAPDPEVASGEAAVGSGADGLADCASPLMRSIYERAVKDVKKGNVPSAVFASSHNAADLTPLITGPEIFPAIGKQIERAEHEVDLQFYVFNTANDPANDIYASLGRLAERRKSAGATEPVTVRLLFSSLSLLGVKTKVPADAVKAFEELKLDPKYVTFEVGMYIHGGLGNLHSKSVVIDGSEAFVTGANVQVQHNYVAPWHDTAYHFSGDVAGTLLAEFDQAWSKAKLWTCGSKADSFGGCHEDTTPLAHVAPSRAAALENACVPMLVVGRPGDGWPFANGTDNTQDQAFFAALDGARKVVRIHTPNLNDDGLKKAIVNAIVAHPETTFEVVLSKGFNDSAENLPTLGGTNEEAAASLYKSLRSAKVERACERLQIRWYSHDGMTEIDGNLPHASHTKYFSVDGQVAIVGSANMDNLAWNHSREVDVVVDSAKITSAWDEAMFEPSFKRGIPAACE